MSFITKRERVFNEYDLFDLPARNEGKLKAYASCTDARAWSHFCSDKSEHLVEIIKRNNDSCRPKYVPTEAIVNTLMVGKNAEISRLQRKIGEFEQMLAAYDDLDLNCEQKCEIAKAHAAIKEANKELDGLFLNLDLSGFTEGGDSEAFETGKSRGDELCRCLDQETLKSKGDETSYFLSQWTFEKEPPLKDSKSIQACCSCDCDASTSVDDSRIQDMQDSIINKDAKLNAMKNTIAVMENDVCEPYCIYAHIFTELVKIFQVLCQNAKYKEYLDLMTSGKDMRGIDVKGKIFFKLKVLEKFSLALIAPCSQNFSSAQECACYRAEMVTRVETAYALTSAETQLPCLDNKRAQLVADIMENDEIKEILSKDNTTLKNDLEISEFRTDNYDIDSENLKRLKNLQENFDDLMTCYEALKHEKNYLLIQCRKYEDLTQETEGLKCQLREYNALWNEKEYYQRRSGDLDNLKEQFMILSDETSNLEVQLKAESEINQVKAKTIDDLRSENLLLEQKLNEASMLFEKEKNYLQCKLKECDCKAMCQDQQIRSLSIQVDRLLEHGLEQEQSIEADQASIALKDEVNSLKEQIKNLKDVCYCNGEDFKTQMNLINELKVQVEYWKSEYEKASEQNDYLEKYSNSCSDEVQKLMKSNLQLTSDVEEKATALKNLLCVIKHNSEDMDRLRNDRELQNKENRDLYKTIQTLQETHSQDITAFNNETEQAIKYVKLVTQESQEVLEKVKDCNDNDHIQNDLATSLKTHREYEKDLSSRDSNNSILHQEIRRLREVNQLTAASISSLSDDKNKYKVLNEVAKKESKIIQEKIHKFEDLSDQLQRLRDSHERLVIDKEQLEKELQNKTEELNDAYDSIKLKRQESEVLVNKLHGSENLKVDLLEIKEAYTTIQSENKALQAELSNKVNSLHKLSASIDNLKTQNELKCQELESLNSELAALKRAYDNLIAEKNMLQSDLEDKCNEINNLNNHLENKIDENKELSQRLMNVIHNHDTVKRNMKFLMEQNVSTKTNLDALRKESDDLMDKVKYYEALESDYGKLKSDYDKIQAEKYNLERILDTQVTDLKRIERENHDLSSHSQDLLSHSEVLEKALINARTQLIVKSSLPDSPHAEVIKEIEELKQEKLNQHKRIRDLLDKLDASESIISNLSEDILARDDRIAVLQNHINQLEDEVRTLHRSLAEVVDAGEQITDYSSQKINQSLKSMEAHHSRATHNMKMELAKLQSENTLLEDKLSATKIRNDESAKDKNKYLSQISHLQNEREIIVTDIKQLEMKIVGGSALSPERCGVEDILASLDRVRLYLDARSSKSTSLEQTLLSVQNSYHLVQTKTDEAKKIVEKEKQKITSEKEEAIKDKLFMEKQLVDLKNQQKLLEQQISQDKNVIKDLEGEILNQKLIIDKLNQSTQNYISKLEDEMKSLQLLYQNALKKASSLENQIQFLNEEKSRNADIVERISKDLEEKIREVGLLNQTLAKLKKEPGRNISIQTLAFDIPTNRNVESQTDSDIKYGETRQTYLQEKYDNLLENNSINPILVNKTTRDNKYSTNNKNKPANEVQVLTANVDPAFDYVKSSYLNYKLQQLSTGRLEQYAISGPSESNDLRNVELSTPDKEITSQDLSRPGSSFKGDPKIQVIDIYNKKSMHTNSSKVIENDDNKNEIDANIGANQIKTPNKSSAFTGFGLTNESLGTDSNSNNEYKNSNIFGTPSEASTDKDMFLIYKDSKSNPDKSYEKKGPWSANGNSEIVVEAVAVHQNKNNQKPNKTHRPTGKQSKEIDSDSFFNAEEEEYDEDDSIKHKLNISLPRVNNDTPSVEASDADKKSLDSYTMAIYSSPKAYSSSNNNADSNIKPQGDQLKTHSTDSISHDDHKYKDDNEKQDIKRDKKRKSYKNETAKREENRFSEPKPEYIDVKESHHKLFRVGADVLLLKPEDDQPIDSNSSKQLNSRDFALEYILDSHNDPDNIKTYTAAKAVRKSRSDERFELNKLLGRNDLSPSRLSELKKSSTDYKTNSTNSNSKFTDKIQLKSYNECSVMVKLDTVDEYENRIQYLTRTLENIEKDYKKKIDAIKMQYDNNIKSILNEHNQGVESIQSLHEETLQDILKIHENEVENLRSMSIEAMRKADKLEKENKSLKNKILDSSSCLDEEPIKISTPELRRRKRSRVEPKSLTKTTVEAFNVRPKSKSYGPCTCSLDIKISDTIRNIFEQVDGDQRKMAEYSYLKYIANKILNGNVDALDIQELSFLHLKVCRIWKTKLTKEESLQKRIDSLEAELMSKQKHTQQNIAELDRKVAEERRRLQEVREAVCRSTPSPTSHGHVPPVPPPTDEKDFRGCCCTSASHELCERRSGGDLATLPTGLRPKRTRNESNRAVLAKLDVEERREREKKNYTDELPTRLRKSHDRAPRSTRK